MYTPSRAEVVMNYKLNEDKQIQATKREQNVDIELKRGTLVLSFTSGAYLIYKAAIYDFYEKSTDRIYHKTTKSSKTSKGSIEKAIVEESLSILDKTVMIRYNIFVSTYSTQQVELVSMADSIGTLLPTIYHKSSEPLIYQK